MDEILQTFAIESAELLEEMESSLLVLESRPDDANSINSVFRAAHTIKGSAGIVGMEQVQDFTHVLENLLELVRRGKITITGDLIGLLLECRDHISTLINESLEGESRQYTLMEGKGLLDRLGEYMGSEDLKPREKVAEAAPEEILTGEIAATDNWHISLRFQPDVLRNGMDPISTLNYLSKLGEVVSMTTLYDSLPAARKMDPESCYLGFEIDFKSDHCDKKAIEEVFEFVREDCRVRILPPKSRVLCYIQLIQDQPEDTMRLGEILVKGGALTNAELNETLRRQAVEDTEAGRSIGEILLDEGIVEPSVLHAAVDKQEAMESRSRDTRTVRVDTEKLDQLINFVGELVIAGASTDQQAKRINDTDLLQSVAVISRLIEEIREKAMSIRMMSLQDTFNRFVRVVRDISRESNKEIELVIRGSETELDKTVLEKIKDPLMHIIRNAADHGIELPDKRVSAGKPREGTLTLNAYQDTGYVVIEISDDGKGLDFDKIYNAAIRMGAVKPDTVLSDNDMLALIFLPGLSTANEVTSISGRGVGMDVVRSNIEALQGSVNVESEDGKGMTVRIRLPLTLAIIEGFLVEVASSHYVVPMNAVVECLELTEAGREAAHGRHFVNLRGDILPYVSLREMFGSNGTEKPKYEHILVVQHLGTQIGVVVDELHGGIQAVIKSLGKFYKGVRGIGAATILGDGTVALVMDIPTLVEIAMEQEEEITRNL